MNRATCLLLVGAALSTAVQPAVAPAPAADDATPRHRLAVALLTAEFLAGARAKLEALRIEQERITATYLQKKAALIWTLDDGGRDLDWYAADELCEELELGGWSDWRLPTIGELEALHDRRSIAPMKLPEGFRLSSCCPWSRTPSITGSAWSFSFLHRERFSGDLAYSYQLRALCVRPAASADQEFYARAEAEAEAAAKARRRGLTVP